MTTTQSTLPARPPEDGPRTHRRSWWIVVVLVLAVVGASVALLLANDDETSTGPSTSGTGTTQPSASTTPSTAPDVDRSTAVWPAAGGDQYTDPVEAAQAFAEDFIGFTSPVMGEFLQGDSRSGEVEVRPSATGPVTTVFVRQLSGEDTWSVLGAATELIEVTEPEAGGTITSPVQLRGAALAFEGNVQVEVREDGKDAAIGTGFVTGGGDMMRPFEGRIDYAIPGSERGALVLFTTSAEDGRVWSAGVMRVAFQTTGAGTVACGDFQPVREAPGPGDMEVKVFFHCPAAGEDALVAVYRHVPKSAGVLEAALTTLLGGPNTAEQAAPISSWFSSDTAGMLKSVTIDAGHAVVDFGDLRSVIPNASSSAGSAQLLAELDATVFQFASVASVEYRIDGSCEAFNEWLQFGGCEARTR